MAAPLQPSTEGIAAAADMYRGDWDANGTTSVHLPTRLATVLLAELGWRCWGDRGWSSPEGGRVYYHADEALQVALAAKALDAMV